MLSGGSPWPVVEHTIITRDSEIKLACWMRGNTHGGTALPCCSCRLWNSNTTHHIVRIQRQHLNLQLPPPALPSYPLGRVLGRAGLAPIQDPQGGLRHDDWHDDWLTTLQSTPLLLKDFDWEQTHKEQLKEMLSVRMCRWVNNSIMSNYCFLYCSSSFIMLLPCCVFTSWRLREFSYLQWRQHVWRRVCLLPIQC